MSEKLQSLRDDLLIARAVYRRQGPTHDAVALVENAYHKLIDAAKRAGENPGHWARAE